jgi:hypothetical protein
MSEFGKGLSYCLGLYLEHAWMWRSAGSRDEIKGGALLWANGASDHLYELEIPENLPMELQARLKAFREKNLNWGHGFKGSEPTIADMNDSISEAHNLLLEIDKAYGIDAEQADVA